MAAYEGIDGVARQISNIYEGIGNVARQVSKGWLGVGGVAREFFSSSIVIFDNGAFQNGFGLYSDKKNYGYGYGDTTGYISGSTLYIPYNSSADGIVNLTIPSDFDPSSYSYMCFDLYFGYTSYCGGVNGGPYEDNTDYAWYAMIVWFNGYYGIYEYDILDDNAQNRLTIKVPISSSTMKYPLFYPRCMRNKTYAATPTTYIYKIWME